MKVFEEHVWRGRFDAARRAVRAHRHASLAKHVLATHSALAIRERNVPPPETLRSLVSEFSEGSPALLCLAAAAVGRVQLLGHHREGLLEVADVLDDLATRPTEREVTSLVLWSRCFRGWASVLGGDTSRGTFERDQEQASALGEAALVLELAALRIAKAMAQGDAESALQLARRASRMARTEAMPQQEYLINVLLARLRRIGGHPHLARRILAALEQVASWPYQDWIRWELRLAGERPAEGGEAHPVDSPLRQAPAHLDASVEAARAGDRAGLNAAIQRLHDATKGWRELHHDVEAFHPMMDPRAPMPHGLQPWATGKTHEAPRGLRYVVLPAAEHEVPGDEACVCVGSGAPARRMLWPAVGSIEEIVVIEPNQGRKRRTERAIALLALSGEEGMGLRELFAGAYGFSYSQLKHEGVLRLLIHRTRERLGNVATIERGEDRVRLVVHRPFAVADPRTAAPVGARVLQYLSAHSGSTARDISKALGIPLRTVQSVLGALVEGGACESVREERQVRYVVEDTTFSEPTQPDAA